MKEGITRWGHSAGMVALALACLCFSASAQAPLDIRVALVIGNSAYANANQLANPANDAKAMGDTLRGLGFTVIELRDGQKAQMAEAIVRVGAALNGKQGVGMLYYAGHGLQLDWRNYMVPVDANLTKASEVPVQTVDVNSVIDAFKAAGNRMNILVLDACRDNPFAGTASGKGLAQVDAPPGTILAYATAPGNVADDGDDKSGNGLYTQFLLQELKKPTAKIEDVFKRVRFQVRQKSQGRQIPWESTSLEDDFFFNTGKIVAQPKLEERLKEAESPEQKAAWEKIENSKSVDDFYTFLLKYPSGGYTVLAQANIQRLQKAQVAAVPNKDGIAQVEGGSRFRLGDTVEWAILNPYRNNVQIGTLRETVTRITADRVETNNGNGTVYTPEGWELRTDDFSFPTGLPILPAGEYQVGMKWTATVFVKGNYYGAPPPGSRGMTAEVAAFEDVTVPAGTFKAYRVHHEWGLTGQQGVAWMDPNWGFPLKYVRTKKRTGWQVTLYGETRVMLSRQRGPG